MKLAHSPEHILWGMIIRNGNLKMTRDKVKHVINILNELSLVVNDFNTMDVALFIWARFGSLSGIDENQLNDIAEIIDNHETIFNEDLLNEIRENDKFYKGIGQ